MDQSYLSVNCSAIPFDHLLVGNDDVQCVMDKYEQRRLALIALRNRIGRGAVGKIAEAIGKDESYISRMMAPPGKAGRKRVTEDFVDLLNQAFPGWLQTGEGPMRDEPVALSGFANATLVQPGRGTRVPLLSTVPAGNWREIVDDYLMGGAPDYDTAFEDVGAHGFALTVDGDSMLPDYRAGDVIFINPDVSPSPGDYVVARNHKFEATFKQYRPRGMNDKGEDYFELVPLNENYPKLRSDLTPIEIIGVVVEHRRKVRRGGV